MQLFDQDGQTIEDTDPRLFSPQTKKQIEAIEAMIFILCCIVAVCLITKQPAYSTEIISVPAHVLAPYQFSGTGPIIPTGKRSYQTAHGTKRVAVVIPYDLLTAMNSISDRLLAQAYQQIERRGNILIGSCHGLGGQLTPLVLTAIWTCQLMGYTPPPHLKVVDASFGDDTHVLLSVVVDNRPKPFNSFRGR